MKVSIALTLCLALAVPAGAAPGFSSERAWEYLIAQCEMGPRNPGSEGHAACLEWMAQALEGWGYSVERHEFSVKDPYGEGRLFLTNLRAWMPGAQDRPLALAAHWDTRPRADRDPDPARRDEPIIGASDGASGVAVLLEVARACAENPPPLPVEFLFFDGEDYGLAGHPEHYLFGSRRFVRDHPQYRPRLLILVDLVGGKTLRLPMEVFSLGSAPGALRDLYGIAAELGLTAFVPKKGWSVWDDHVPFIEKGIPAVDFVDLDYPQWHTTADRPDACSPRSLAQVGDLLIYAIFETPDLW